MLTIERVLSQRTVPVIFTQGASVVSSTFRKFSISPYLSRKLIIDGLFLPWGGPLNSAVATLTGDALSTQYFECDNSDRYVGLHIDIFSDFRPRDIISVNLELAAEWNIYTQQFSIKPLKNISEAIVLFGAIDADGQVWPLPVRQDYSAMIIASYRGWVQPFAAGSGLRISGLNRTSPYVRLSTRFYT